MPKRGENISLKSFDDIFSTEEARQESQQERVQQIPLSELHEFEGHPFRVIDDEEILIYFLNSKAPCFIRDEKESYIYLILPVNFVV